jgi:hypothetical protein
VKRQYDGHKVRIKQIVQSARSQVHISCDLWTSPNSLAILGIVAHFVSEDGQLQHVVLALREMEGVATGVDLASEVIIKVIDDWGIVLNIGYFMMDNAPNNDTMIAELSRGKDDVISREWPNLISDLLRNSRSIFDPKKRRLRCMGHILNLACKSQIGESG